MSVIITRYNAGTEIPNGIPIASVELTPGGTTTMAYPSNAADREMWHISAHGGGRTIVWANGTSERLHDGYSKMRLMPINGSGNIIADVTA